ncbi:MAG: DUF2332 domain-containing protein [Burkholderiales bacterium]|nr:DUF2332 domain-containing protein [Burkholderiales bacterium]
MDDALILLRERFLQFADAHEPDDRLYGALARAIAGDADLLGLLIAAAPTQRLPVLLLAAMHAVLLDGSPHPLRHYYPSCGGTRPPDAELLPRLRDFAREAREPLLHLLRTRQTQTNEIGRCAVLWPALQQVALLRGGEKSQPLALLDFGCSAGLNLGVDAYRFDDAEGGYGASAGAGPCLDVQWRGGRPALLGPARWHLAARVGTDLAPLSPADPSDARWLQACLWPSDTARRQRLDAALALAVRRGDRLLRCTDGLAALQQAAATLPPGVQPVLFNSWVLAYLDEAAFQQHRERALALVRERGWAWICAEAASRCPLQQVPAVPAGESSGSASIWSLHWRAPGGEVREQALAWSHPHGRWASWLG